AEPKAANSACAPRLPRCPRLPPRIRTRVFFMDLMFMRSGFSQAARSTNIGGVRSSVGAAGQTLQRICFQESAAVHRRKLLFNVKIDRNPNFEAFMRTVRPAAKSEGFVYAGCKKQQQIPSL